MLAGALDDFDEPASSISRVRGARDMEPPPTSPPSPQVASSPLTQQHNDCSQHSSSATIGFQGNTSSKQLSSQHSSLQHISSQLSSSQQHQSTTSPATSHD